MVTKVEKSYEMNIWLNPKYSQQWVFSNETPKQFICMENAQRLFPCGEVHPSGWKNTALNYSKISQNIF